ncbi:MAG TPA: BadF/BadG/BcrA/BcrD ATPase family protein [Symbiobacteriaceae bacterium]|nr:BadF/BadG/BcrA/BcrD ATPase family protein [Symbiobacteriaceae bacterium]
MSAPGLLVGIDGGGTKTRCLVADMAGRILGEGHAGPSNYQAVGQQAATAALRSAVDAALAAAGGSLADVTAACAGLAGVARPEDRPVMLEALAFLAPARVELVTDARIALEGALGGAPGVIVISGTGSIAMGRNAAGELFRAGGWGWILGDDGSGFDIGRRAIAGALAALDGMGPATSLGERICAAWGLERLNQVVPRVYGDVAQSRPAIAALVPLVVQVASEGDTVAAAILDGAGRELGRLACAVLAKMQMPNGLVAVTGGVVTGVPAVRAALEEALAGLAPGARVIDGLVSPAEGALLMARALCAQ